MMAIQSHRTRRAGTSIHTAQSTTLAARVGRVLEDNQVLRIMQLFIYLFLILPCL